MGASASVSISGVTAASDTSWGWWNLKGARAATYTFTGSAVADAVPAPPPLTAGPLAKFGGPPTVAIVWPPLNLSSTGALGSTAVANMVGASNVGWFFYGCDMAVSAATSAAARGGTATASASGTDPWEVTYRHQPGQKSYVLLSLVPDFSLSPARGNAGFELFGSFGKISLSLNSLDNNPLAEATLEPGWLVYEGVQLPTVGHHLRAPQDVLGKQELENMFLRQHDPSAPLWIRTEPATTLTFVKEVPHSTTTEVVEAGLAVVDEDAGEGVEQQRTRV